MLERAKQLRIMVESNRRSLDQISAALEALELGSPERTNYSSLRRAFHTVKHEARHLRLAKLADVAEAAETIVGEAANRKVGLPLELLRAAAQEIEAATNTIHAGGRHRLDPGLLERLRAAAASPRRA